MGQPASPALVRARRPRTSGTLRAATLAAGLVATLAAGLATAPGASAANPPTPGAFTGYGFDQCQAPAQASMDAWWASSPFKAAGIYISGDSRGCPVQYNLSSTWVAQQLATGWKLLPITLGPQASCTSRDKYKKETKINPDGTNNYAAARAQGAAEANKTVGAAQGLGLVPGSTMYYDLEAWPISSSAACNDSAMAFLSGWTTQLHALGYVSGAYSSAGSGIKVMDAARSDARFLMPDQLWIADWNGVASSHTNYIPDDGWAGQRIHQYQGGHNETWGGVTINIDSNWLELGGVAISTAPACGTPAKRQALHIGSKKPKAVKILQCRLTSSGFYSGAIHGKYNKKTGHAVKKFRHTVGMKGKRTDWTRGLWNRLLARG